MYSTPTSAWRYSNHRESTYGRQVLGKLQAAELTQGMGRTGGDEFAEELLKEQGIGDVADGIAKRYGVHTLVWYKAHATMEIAITREKAIKGWKRAWKMGLIEKSNPDWPDLYEELT